MRVVASHSPGTGKSLYIRHLANQIKGDVPNKHVIIPIHSPDVSNDSIVTSYLHYQSTGTAQLIHFDISPSVSIFET